MRFHSIALPGRTFTDTARPISFTVPVIAMPGYSVLEFASWKTWSVGVMSAVISSCVSGCGSMPSVDTWMTSEPRASSNASSKPLPQSKGS